MESMDRQVQLEQQETVEPLAPQEIKVLPGLKGIQEAKGSQVLLDSRVIVVLLDLQGFKVKLVRRDYLGSLA